MLFDFFSEDFLKPKICWKAVGKNLTFSIVESGIFLTAPASFISAGEANEYIIAFLCSNVGKYFIYQNSDTTGAGDILLNIQSLIRFPIPKPNTQTKLALSQHVEMLQQTFDIDIQEKIDTLIYNLYGFDEQEIAEIEFKIL